MVSLWSRRHIRSLMLGSVATLRWTLLTTSAGTTRGPSRMRCTRCAVFDCKYATDKRPSSIGREISVTAVSRPLDVHLSAMFSLHGLRRTLGGGFAGDHNVLTPRILHHACSLFRHTSCDSWHTRAGGGGIFFGADCSRGPVSLAPHSVAKRVAHRYHARDETQSI